MRHASGNSQLAHQQRAARPHPASEDMLHPAKQQRVQPPAARSLQELQYPHLRLNFSSVQQSAQQLGVRPYLPAVQPGVADATAPLAQPAGITASQAYSPAASSIPRSQKPSSATAAPVALQPGGSMPVGATAAQQQKAPSVTGMQVCTYIVDYCCGCLRLTASPVQALSVPDRERITGLAQQWLQPSQQCEGAFLMMFGALHMLGVGAEAGNYVKEALQELDPSGQAAARYQRLHG